jgi:hypothetical protein
MIIFDLFESFLHVRPRPGIISHFPCPLDDMAVSSSSTKLFLEYLRGGHGRKHENALNNKRCPAPFTHLVVIFVSTDQPASKVNRRATAEPLPSRVINLLSSQMSLRNSFITPIHGWFLKCFEAICRNTVGDILIVGSSLEEKHFGPLLGLREPGCNNAARCTP